MNRRYLCLGMILLAGAMLTGTLYAGKNEPWKEKPFDQWTDKDVQTVFTDSPWSQQVTVEATWKPLSAEDVSASAAGSVVGVGGGGQAGGSSAIMPAEHDSNAVTRGQNTPFNVYWMSSRTMREAVARKAELHSGTDPKTADDYVAEPKTEFEVAVQGTDLAPFQRTDEKKYQDMAWLQLKKSKEKIMPSHVTYKKDDRGLVSAAIFYFPKKDSAGNPTIAPDTKAVEFACKVGASTIHATFDPSKMTDTKGSDL